MKDNKSNLNNLDREREPILQQTTLTVYYGTFPRVAQETLKNSNKRDIKPFTSKTRLFQPAPTCDPKDPNIAYY